MAEETKTANNQKRIILLLVLVIIVLVAAGGALAFYFLNQEKPAEDGGGDAPELGYAEGTTVVRDENALQKALDDMAAKVAKGSMVLEYEADAYSVNGKDFKCYLANAPENTYDMYFDMYNGSNIDEQLFLSGLLKPGQALDKIELNTALSDGDHSAVLFFTTVEDDHKTLHSQISVTMNLHVGAQYAKSSSSASN